MRLVHYYACTVPIVLSAAGKRSSAPQQQVLLLLVKHYTPAFLCYCSCGDQMCVHKAAVVIAVGQGWHAAHLRRAAGACRAAVFVVASELALLVRSAC